MSCELFRNIAEPVTGRVTNNVGEIEAAIRALQICKQKGRRNTGCPLPWENLGFAVFRPKNLGKPGIRSF